APGEKGDVGPEKYQDAKPNEKQVARLMNVSHPTLTVYAPPADQANGTAVVICPGGGYNILAFDLEGTEVAEWLNKQGVTAFVLKYRVPKRAHLPNNLGPQQDAQRAMSLVRSQAQELKINPERIGILGFSAGGHLAAMTSMHFEKRCYDKLDAVDEVSSRPDFAILIYPAYLTNKDATELSPEVVVSDKTPPVFFAHAGDDPVTPLSSVLMYAALKRAKVPAELHVYATGGHGYGLRSDNSTAANWPLRCEEWLKGRALIK
ncbi:MAG TPA: alpha/beta hydrolase, partial [Pirellulaceae bacterium]|nr:alpha/beta hydrolase [Pirellulaceae bacterium]